MNHNSKDLQSFQQQQTNIRPPIMNSNIRQIRQNQCQMSLPNSPQFLQHQMRSQNQHAALNAMPVSNVVMAQAQREWYEAVYKKITSMQHFYIPYLLKFQELLVQGVTFGDGNRTESDKQSTAKIIAVLNQPQSFIKQYSPAKLEENVKKMVVYCSIVQKAITNLNEQHREKNLARQINEVASEKSPESIHTPPLKLNAPQITRSTPPRTNFSLSDPNIPTLKLNAPQISRSNSPRTNFGPLEPNIPTLKLKAPQITRSTPPRTNFVPSDPNIPTLKLKAPEISRSTPPRTYFGSSDPNTAPLGKRTNQSPPCVVSAVSVGSTKKTAKTLTSENQQPVEPLINAVKSISQEDVIIDTPPLAKNTNPSPPHRVCSVSEKIPETLTSENEQPIHIKRLINAVKSISSEALFAAYDDMQADIVLQEQPSPFCLSYTTNKRRRVFDVEPALTSNIKKPKLSVIHTLQGTSKLFQEIEEINSKLVETTVELDSNSYDKFDGTIVKISYAGYRFAQIFKMPYLQNMPNISTRLRVPADYPNSSPIVLDALNDASSLLLLSENTEDVIKKVNVRFRLSLRKLPELYSIEEMARIWDACALTIFKEYSDAIGANCLSSRYGNGECITST